MRVGKGSNADRPKVIFMVSVGRSGSTFFSKRLAYHANLHYFGEKRFLWSSLRVMPFLGAMLLYRNTAHNIENKTILDKTPCMHKYIVQAARFVEIKGVVLLERDIQSVRRSSTQMESDGTGISRIFLRLEKYWAEYGIFFLLAAASRFHHLFHAFGMKTGAFGRSLFSKPLEEEAIEMSHEIHEFCRQTGTPLVEVNYNNFQDDCQSLRSLEISSNAIHQLVEEFSPSK